MTINITISGSSGNDSLADTVSLGQASPSTDTEFQDLFIRHDAAVNPIEDCAFYVTRYSGSDYLGNDPDADFTEIMGWGAAASGGFIINQVVPPGWVIDTQFDPGDDQVFKNGYGDVNSQLSLIEDAIINGTPDGDKIPVAGEAHVQVRAQIPASVPDGAGYRAIQLIMAYSATS